MRLRIKLGIEPGSSIDFNYQWYLSSAVYSCLSRAAPDFTKTLHDVGFPHLDGPSFKFFTFSNLWAGRGKTGIDGGKLVFDTDHLLWRFASPIPAVSTLFAEGLLSLGTFRIAGLEAEVMEVSDEGSPDLGKGSASFSCISPLVASEADEKLGHRYLTPDQVSFWAIVENNLYKKWETLHGTAPKDKVLFKPDRDYISSRNTGKKITIKERYIVKGHLVPFSVEGPPELLSLGYYAGFGSRNSLGFGMVEIYNRR